MDRVPVNSTIWPQIFCAVGRQSAALACVCGTFRNALGQPATLALLCETLWPGVAGDERTTDAAHMHALFQRLARAVPKWKTFRHNGVLFKPPYTDRLGAPLLYAGEPVELTLEQEEMMVCYVEHLANPLRNIQPPMDDVWHSNLMKSWRAILDKTEAGSNVMDFALCDFSALRSAWVQDHGSGSAARGNSGLVNLTMARKVRGQQARQEAAAPFASAQVDGKVLEIPKFPPVYCSIFLGPSPKDPSQGHSFNPALESHPLRGTFKPRMTAEEITLNLDRRAPVPPVPDHGDGEVHTWGRVLSNPTVLWIAKYRDVISGTFQYIFPSSRGLNRPEDDPWAQVKITPGGEPWCREGVVDAPLYNWGTGANGPTPTCPGECTWGNGSHDGNGKTWTLVGEGPGAGGYAAAAPPGGNRAAGARKLGPGQRAPGFSVGPAHARCSTWW
jgi:hypothetical protein